MIREFGIIGRRSWMIEKDGQRCIYSNPTREEPPATEAGAHKAWGGLFSRAQSQNPTKKGTQGPGRRALTQAV